jgi:centromere protein C
LVDHAGPVNNLANMRPPSTPTTLKRVGSSRPVARTSDVDFDRIPSPKFRSQSKANYGPGPSNLSKSISRRDVQPESDSPDEGGGYDDGGQNNVDMDVDDGNGAFDFDDYGPRESSPSSRRTPKQTSFAEMSQDDDEEEGEEDEPPEETPTKDKRDKGKGRAVVEEELEDEEVENDIANGLEDVEQEHYSDDEEEEEEPEVRPKGKKVKLSEETKPKRPTETRSRGKKENKRQFFYSQHPTC